MGFEYRCLVSRLGHKSLNLDRIEPSADLCFGLRMMAVKFELELGL
jgi:hypothetical protein